MNDTLTTITYLGKEYTINNSIQFIQAVRKTMVEDEEMGKEVDSTLFSLKTLKEFYDTEAMRYNNIIELILPSYDLADAEMIRDFVNQSLYKYLDKVVLLHYPREMELIVMPLIYSAKAVLARDNHFSNQGTCVCSTCNEYVIGQTYKW